MQKMILFSAFVLLTAVVLSGCMANNQDAINTNAMQQKPVNDTQKTANETQNLGVDIEVSANQSASQETACEDNSVYFIHADWCPHCQKMKPLVTELEGQGYRFVRVTSENLATYKGCLTGVAKMQYIPEFVCLSNKQSHVGAFESIDELKAFADACGASS